MSASSFERAAVKAGFPHPPGTSLFGMLHSSLYCIQESVSRISGSSEPKEGRIYLGELATTFAILFFREYR
jgi:hypothetical protein